MGLRLAAASELPIGRRKARGSERWGVIGRAAVGVAVVGSASDEEKTKHTFLFSWVPSILGTPQDVGESWPEALRRGSQMYW